MRALYHSPAKNRRCFLYCTVYFIGTVPRTCPLKTVEPEARKDNRTNGLAGSTKVAMHMGTVPDITLKYPQLNFGVYQLARQLHHQQLSTVAYLRPDLLRASMVSPSVSDMRFGSEVWVTFLPLSEQY